MNGDEPQLGGQPLGDAPSLSTDYQHLRLLDALESLPKLDGEEYYRLRSALEVSHHISRAELRNRIFEVWVRWQMFWCKHEQVEVYSSPYHLLIMCEGCGKVLTHER
jgi:ribosomal protein S27E